MAAPSSYLSLRTSFSSALILVSFVALLSSIITTAFYGDTKSTEASVRFAKSITKIVSFNSETPLAFDQRKSVADFLSTLKDIESIVNIHVYRVDDLTGEIDFFSSYNQQGFPPVSDQKHRVANIYQPIFQENYIEYAQPVKEGGSEVILGYVYIRLQFESFSETMVELGKYNAIIGLALTLFAVALSIIVRRRVINPVQSFVKDLETMTDNKNFSGQVKSVPLVELKPLVDSINIMLTRINQQFVKSTEAEKEIKELNQSLEEKVVTRTQALRDSNQELLDALEQVHQYQSQVIQSEKMASLGQMVAGVAHEVNTPIGLGVTASTMLSDKVDEIKEALENKSLSANKLERFLDDSKENAQIIYRNLSRAADLISSFKQVAVDQTADNVRMVQLNEFLNEVITSLHPTLKKSNHNIVVECDEKLEILTKPGPINQVLINLIMNSVIHAYDEGQKGNIEIKVWSDKYNCNIEFKDDGKGIEEKIKQKIFDPFVTTRRGEGGSGLGMHLVYNLVTQALNGQIQVQSELGKGATFSITFPIGGGH